MNLMQLIAVDIGNSSTKIAVQQSPDDQRWWREAILDNALPFDSLANDHGNVHLDAAAAFWSVSSVNQTRAQQLQDWIHAHRPEDQFHLIRESEVSITSNVELRSGVGRDRLVAAAMALELNDGTGPLIVVDAGTAVTVDWVDHQAVFQGGLIFPGATANLKMLSDSTDALPDLSAAQYFDLVGDLKTDFHGKSTHPAILRGVYQSQIGAIKQIVDHQSAGCESQPVVYLTGGGISPIDTALPTSWTRVPDLVLRGARSIGRRLMAQAEKE